MVSWLSVLTAAVIPVLRLIQQARTPTMSSTHEHAFLELCYASDSEVAAVVVEHSVVIRVTSFEDVQLTSRRPALHRLLMICKAYEVYEVVANIWVSIPCTAGAPFMRINEKLGAETGDHAMTYKLEVAAVDLCRHDVVIGDGFSWKWSIGNELWKSVVVVRNLFVRGGSSSCLVSTAAVGQQFVDREGGVFHVKMLEMIKKVTGAVHVHIFHHQLRDAKDNADGNGFNRSVQPYVVVIHLSTLLRRYFFGLQGTQWMPNSAKGVSCSSTRGETSPQPIENKSLAVYDVTFLVSSDDYLASDLFMPGALLMQYGLRPQCGEASLVLPPEDTDGCSVAILTI